MKKEDDFFHEDDIYGVTVVGERGQAVIPKKVRDKLKIKSGDSFLVVERGGAIFFVPTKKIKGMMSAISQELSKIK